MHPLHISIQPSFKSSIKFVESNVSFINSTVNLKMKFVGNVFISFLKKYTSPPRHKKLPLVSELIKRNVFLVRCLLVPKRIHLLVLFSACILFPSCLLYFIHKSSNTFHTNAYIYIYIYMNEPRKTT